MNRFVYRVSKGAARLLFNLLFRWEVIGTEHVPDQGPAILCANHRSNWDPPLVGVVAPRPVHFMAKEELFRSPVLAAWLRAVGAFPVKRRTADLGGIRHALDLLKQGHIVGLFPEGTRSRTGGLQEAHGGVVMLALSAGAPVVPVAISGETRLFGRVRVRIGAPIDLSPYRREGKRGAPEMSAIANEVIMGRIRELIAEADSSRCSVGDGRAEPASSAPVGRPGALDEVWSRWR